MIWFGTGPVATHHADLPLKRAPNEGTSGRMHRLRVGRNWRWCCPSTWNGLRGLRSSVGGRQGPARPPATRSLLARNHSPGPERPPFRHRRNLCRPRQVVGFLRMGLPRTHRNRWISTVGGQSPAIYDTRHQPRTLKFQQLAAFSEATRCVAPPLGSGNRRRKGRAFARCAGTPPPARTHRPTPCCAAPARRHRRARDGNAKAGRQCRRD
jgi:hypothetical protein